MKLWQITALVVFGLIVGEVEPGYFGGFFHFATFNVFLPAIIFEASWQLDVKMMLRGWRPIVLLAVPGVVITAVVITGVVRFAGGAPLGTALVLGVVLSATDPVAVTAIFRKLRVPRLLTTIVESESLLNDAIAVVLYRGVIAVVTIGVVTGGTIGATALQGVLGSVLGVIAGGAIGFLASYALRRGTPVALQIVVTFAAAYLAYGISEQLRWSGIFATIACAITMRELERTSVTVDMAAGVERAWSVAAAASNAVLFFLIGASVQLSHLWQLRAILLWTIAAVVVSRILLAYGLLRLAPKLERSWMTVVRLAGVRGAVSLALALGIPREVPQGDVVISATFAVVVATILIGSMTYERRIGRLGLER